MQKKLAVVILGAGKGTRMKSPLAKVLQLLSGRPLLHYVLETAGDLRPDRRIVVVGYQAEEVKERFRGGGLEFVEQKNQLGTGHAVQQVVPALSEDHWDILVLCGDMPFLRTETLNHLIRVHREGSAAVTLLVLKSSENKDFGRIVRDASGALQRIVEHRDATDEEKKIDEFNSGIYCFDGALLFQALEALRPDNAQREYYLTDTISFFIQHGHPVQTVSTGDADEIFGINSQEDLKTAEQIMQDRVRSA